MLNANGGSPYEAHALPAVLGDAASIWDDASQAGSSRSRPEGRGISLIDISDDMQERLGPSTSNLAGLRSRKASVHRRASSLTPASHPLQLSSSQTSPMAGRRKSVTRRRQVSESMLLDLDDSDGFHDDDFERETLREAEVLVIVHEILNTDSIAGVALKYGIALADLRKANRLLASDSIHLRKELYIPLHLSDRKYALFNGEHDEPDEAQASSSSEPSVAIKRVPASKLAFFPPPTSASFPSNQPSFASASTSASSYSTASLNWNVNTFLHSLPIPSKESLAHTFFSRLSMDSSETSSAYGTPTGPLSLSETSSEMDTHEVELEMEVLSSGESREFEGLGMEYSEPRTPRVDQQRERTRGKERGRNTIGRSFLPPQSKATVKDTFELCMPGQAANTLGGYASLGMSPHGKRTAHIISSQPQPHVHQMRPSPQMQAPRQQ